MKLDDTDRAIINHLQGGFPVCDRPYAEVGNRLGVTERELLERLGRMLGGGILSRFGPLFNAGEMGGGLTLCAMAVPEERFEDVAQRVNAFPEVAHNYAREHRFNMWFVIATEVPERIDEVVAEIERETGLPVYDMPKKREFFVGLRFDV